MRFRSLLCTSILFGAISVAHAADPLVGRWALTLPGGGAGWLGLEQADGTLKASLLWGGGSVLPVPNAKEEGQKVTLTRTNKSKTGEITETITGTVAGDEMKLTTVKTGPDGKEMSHADFVGHRIPPVPPAPDLAKVKFGAPIELFDGKDLTGWRLVNPKSINGWSVQDGVLQNRVEHGKPNGNLRTDREFTDFNLKLECRTQKDSNSGIYLRGIYEIQVAESFGKALDPHNMGALYSRITPSVAAEKPIGEWQTFDITLD